MKKETPIFWGCTLIHNYPFLMESTKKILSELGVHTTEREDFSCCPDPVYLSASSEDLQLAVSARNLALAEEKDDELLVVCNGCYNVLHEADSKLKDNKLRDEVNTLLPTKLKYDGRIKVVHVLNVLHSKLPLLRTHIKKPLKGLKVAAHYGCHAIYPAAVPSDNPKNPESMDEIIEATGAESIDYESKLDCCGASVITFDKEEGDELLRNKLWELQGKVDCIVTACPACFMRFDLLSAEMKDLSIPVLHISELLCLAFGISQEELFLEGHMTKVTPVLDKIGLKPNKEEDLINEHFNREELLIHCEACRKECTAAESTADSEKPFDPLATVDLLLEGKYYEVIRGDEIWRCLQCGKCEERCPTNSGLKDLFLKLRELAIEDGKSVRIIDDKIKMLEETGYGMPQRVGVRKRMGIDPVKEMDTSGIKKIVSEVKKKKKK